MQPTLFQSNLSWNVFSAKSSLHTRCTRCLEYKYMYVFIAELNRASGMELVRITGPPFMRRPVVKCFSKFLPEHGKDELFDFYIVK